MLRELGDPKPPILISGVGLPPETLKVVLPSFKFCNSSTVTNLWIMRFTMTPNLGQIHLGKALVNKCFLRCHWMTSFSSSALSAHFVSPALRSSANHRIRIDQSSLCCTNEDDYGFWNLCLLQNRKHILHWRFDCSFLASKQSSSPRAICRRRHQCQWAHFKG